MASTPRKEDESQSEDALPHSLRVALLLLGGYTLQSTLFLGWALTARDGTEVGTVLLFFLLPVLGAVVLFVGLLRRAQAAWWAAVIVVGWQAIQRLLAVGYMLMTFSREDLVANASGVMWSIVSALLLLLFVLLLTARESRRALRIAPG